MTTDVELKVGGMSCDHCQRSVTQALAKLDGVADVAVDLEKGTAKVSFDPAKVSVNALKEAVEDAGYDVTS